ncbi:RNA recognition motif domain-containing protein [Mucilaginibacter sp.]|uniref:RNA recognition motif domain-containing protein n=1 Tax=Mucilaginibacter sp. TaxID=1882438 RepID=UPI003D13C3B0
MVKLFIVGLPRDMEETELLEIFTVYGQVGIITIVTDQNTGESKGYGFVHMEDQAGADRAIAALNGAEIDDRTISVRIAEPKQPEVVAPPVRKKRQRIGN